MFNHYYLYLVKESSKGLVIRTKPWPLLDSYGRANM